MADRCPECWHAMALHEGFIEEPEHPADNFGRERRCSFPGCGCGAGAAPLALPTWAVVPSKDAATTASLAASLAGQVHGVCVVDNTEDGMDIEPLSEFGFAVLRLRAPGYPPHLYRMYNAGMDAVDQLLAAADPAPAMWNVCLLNDDVICPPGWASSLETALRSTGCVLAYTDRLGRAERQVMTTPPAGFNESATLWAAMIRGEAGVRYDERFRWWYGDNDLDLRCRLEHGGTVAVPGPMPNHHRANSSTYSDPVLSRIANHEDAPAFTAKWADRL